MKNNDELNHTFKKMENNIRNISEDRENLKTKINSLNDEIENLNIQMNEWIETAESRAKRIKSMESEIDELTKKRDEFTNIVGKNKGNVDVNEVIQQKLDLEKKVSELEVMLAVASKKTNEYEGRLSTARIKRNTRNSTYARLTMNLMEQTNRESVLKSSNSLLKDQLDDEKLKSTNLNSTVEKLRDELSNIRKEKLANETDFKKQISSLSSKLQLVQYNTDNLVQSIYSEIIKLSEKEKESFAEILKEYKYHDNDDIIQKLDAVENQHIESTEVIESLNTIINDQLGELEELRTKIKTLEDKNESLRRRVKQEAEEFSSQLKALEDVNENLVQQMMEDNNESEEYVKKLTETYMLQQEESEKQYKMVKDKLDKAESELIKAKKKLSETQEELDNCKQDYEEQMNMLLQQNIELSTKLASM
ncbi:hypothetical protein H8356DRAFT_921682 [Neocallimastix lanati (nom. inval.)]|uniref:Uncharacterized protein n=1 Tax=Neocallimastix californiae TaxID=1754190 RepID=A0A1Y2EUI8_9FUNG|nr:hypothetical protein H8356DRAFT_921682 [Neocallimastix sp. JGI-2020a]ORY75228.1 hypothetical protein LY90DRAFT_502237 [Neocallimastix californiae]|eukprot:ORY75228.1 hypothetical protein LY90DRAFT_502237 [Neocallimastix californiae]